MQDLGDAAFLDLGNGYGVIFLDQDAESLTGLLQTRMDFW